MLLVSIWYKSSMFQLICIFLNHRSAVTKTHTVLTSTHRSLTVWVRQCSGSVTPWYVQIFPWWTRSMRTWCTHKICPVISSRLTCTTLRRTAATNISSGGPYGVNAPSWTSKSIGESGRVLSAIQLRNIWSSITCSEYHLANETPTIKQQSI